jgi:hypothetical protein
MSMTAVTTEPDLGRGGGLGSNKRHREVMEEEKKKKKKKEEKEEEEEDEEEGGGRGMTLPLLESDAIEDNA